MHETLCIFHTKSVPERRWSTFAVRRVRDGLVCGRIMVGAFSDRFRIVNGVASVFRACAVDRIPLWFATVGSFLQCKWDCKWCWWISCRWSFEGSFAPNAFFLHFGASDFPSKNPFKKCFKIGFFFALASRSGFGATISDAVARSSIVFCNSVSADRIIMAAWRLLHAVAACVILLSFAAGLRKSYGSGCMKAATVICQQIFSILALVIFLLKILLKSASKSSFFRSGVEIHSVLELQFPTPLRV